MLDKITPLIVTYNEGPNLKRVITKLLWATRIVVIDSGSTDDTLEILKRYQQVEVINRPFDNFGSQCNFGLTQIKSPWVLSIDADYELSDELIAEIKLLDPPDAVAGYRVGFVYRIYGNRLRGSLYPPRTVLYRPEKAHYFNEGHGHRVSLSDEVIKLNKVIYHDDRKPLARWISSQRRYAEEEATYLLNSPDRNLSKFDRVRAIGWPAPILVLVYTLFVKGCIFDGWPGWHYTLQRLLFETLTALEIVDRRLRRRNLMN
jgi:glycosyltransferase involved in cell wall biosynthesis